MSNYSISRLDSLNLKHLYTLFVLVYHKSCSKQHFHLKYATHYTGAEYIGFFAFENNIPVAYYGIIPTIVSINSQPVLAGQACDAMTHPKYRKKGLFQELVTRTIALAQQKGIHFIFGFPNQNSFSILTDKLGFVHSQTMNRYSLPFSDNLFKLLYRKFGFLNLKKHIVHIENSMLKEGYDGIIYNKEYIQYKAYNKNKIIQTSNFSFWENASNELWVGALWPIEENKITETINKIQTITNNAITFMVSENTKLDTLLSKNLKPEKGFSVITKNLTNTYNLEKLKFQFSDIDIF